MPKYIIHHEGAYNLYTTVMDGACYEEAMTREQLEQLVKDEQGNEGLRELSARLERAHRTGCSSHTESLDDCLVANRAGPNETELSKEEFIKRFLTLPERRSADSPK